MVSPVLARLGGGIGGRTAALIVTGGLTAAGAGVWWAVHGPALHVVQRSAQVVVAGGGEQATVAGCAGQITDPQATTWQLIGPNGPVTLGHGTSATITVPLLADGTYPVELTARDPAGGLTGRARIDVRITGCLR